MIIEESTEEQFINNLRKTYTTTDNEERLRAEKWLQDTLKMKRCKSTLLKLLLDQNDRQINMAAISIAKWLDDTQFFMSFFKNRQVSARLAKQLQPSLTAMLKNHDDKQTLLNIILSQQLCGNSIIFLCSILQASQYESTMIEAITAEMNKIIQLTVNSSDSSSLLNIFQFFQLLFDLTAEQEETYYEIASMLSENTQFKNKMINLLAVSELQYIILHLINITYEQPLEQLFNYCLKQLKNDANYQNLQMLDRYVNSRKYYQYFQNHKADVLLSLMKCCTADQKERQMQPQDFVFYACDFCQRQELQQNKIKASTILDSMCHNVDGTLSFVVEIVMKAVWKNQSVSFYLPSVNHEELKLQNLEQSSFFKMPRENMVQASLLILCSLSDKIEKRQDLLKIVLECIENIPWTQLTLICQLRYIMLLSYYPSFLNKFISVAASSWNNEVTRQQTVDGYTRIHERMKYKARQSEEFKKYQVFINEFLKSVQIEGKLLTTLIDKISQIDDCRFSILFERMLNQIVKSEQTQLNAYCIAFCRLIQKMKENIDKYEKMFVNVCSNIRDGALCHVLATWLDKSPTITFLNSLILQQINNFMNNKIDLEDISQMLNKYFQLNIPYDIVPTLLSKIESQDIKDRYAALLLLEQIIYKTEDIQVAALICSSLPAVMYKDAQNGFKITLLKIIQCFIMMDVKFGTTLVNIEIVDRFASDVLAKASVKAMKIHCLYLINYLKNLVQKGSDTTIIMKQIVILMKMLPRWKNDDRDDIQKIDMKMKHHFQNLDEYAVLRQIWQEIGGRMKLVESDAKEELQQLLKITKFKGKQRKVVKIKRY